MKALLRWNETLVESDESEPVESGTACEACGRSDVSVASYTWHVPDPYTLLLCDVDAASPAPES